jgi:hypothetical protein
LDAAELQMDGMFAPGMFYVGLSRITSLDGLSLKDFNRRLIRTHEVVLRWYRNNFTGNTTAAYQRYYDRLMFDHVPLGLEEVRDFFTLYAMKYFPLSDPSRIGNDEMRVACNRVNDQKSPLFFNILLC